MSESGEKKGDCLLQHLEKAEWNSTPTSQFDYAFLVKIKPGQTEGLETLLSEIALDVAAYMRGEEVSSSRLPLWEVKTLHYARWVILPKKEGCSDGELIFSLNIDGDSDADARAAARKVFTDLIRIGNAGISEIYSHCEGSPAKGAAPLEWLSYFMDPSRSNPASAFYCASSGRSLVQIQNEKFLSIWLREQYAALRRESHGLSAKAILAELRKRYPFSLPVAFPAQPSSPRLVKVLTWAAGAVALLTAPFWAPVLRYKETHDAVFEPENSPAQRAHDASVAGQEDFFFQNQLTHIVPMKDGWFRSFLINVVFLGLRVLAKYEYTHGKLGSIPSIHFARWIRIHEGKDVLFFSNFDSSWESYLGDFVDKASIGLTGVWSNTKGFPRTKWLIKAGSEDEQRFKAWTRAHQIRTQLWYAAYPGLSIRNVNDQTMIRRGFASDEAMSAQEFVSLL